MAQTPDKWTSAYDTPDDPNRPIRIQRRNARNRRNRDNITSWETCAERHENHSIGPDRVDW